MLTFEDNKLMHRKWYRRDPDDFKVMIGSHSCCFSETPNPGSVESEYNPNFKEELYAIYSMFGVLEDMTFTSSSTVCVVKDANKTKEQKELLELVYSAVMSIKVPTDTKFISVRTCRCNMGRCGACTSYDFMDYKTYGDIISSYGEESEIHGFCVLLH